MNIVRPQRLLFVLLIASMALNTWPFLHSQPPAENTARKPVAVNLARIVSTPGTLSGKKPSAAQEDEEDAGPTLSLPPTVFRPSRRCGRTM